VISDGRERKIVGVKQQKKGEKTRENEEKLEMEDGPSFTSQRKGDVSAMNIYLILEVY
jgi:hypothetical protein